MCTPVKVPRIPHRIHSHCQAAGAAARALREVEANRRIRWGKKLPSRVSVCTRIFFSQSKILKHIYSEPNISIPAFATGDAHIPALAPTCRDRTKTGHKPSARPLLPPASSLPEPVAASAARHASKQQKVSDPKDTLACVSAKAKETKADLMNDVDPLFQPI